MERAWRLAPQAPDGFAQSLGLPPFEAQLLYNRGIRDAEEADAFLRAGDDLSHDPELLPDMDKATRRIGSARFMGETVGVFGDFDVDGISGAAIVAKGLRDLGMRVIPRLPHREDDGHGLNASSVEELAAQGVGLIITVDNGIDAVDEVDRALSLGVHVIVTDHHTPSSRLPKAEAIVNPRLPESRYPESGLTGAGLAYKLMEGLWRSLDAGRPERLLELAALGTVADVAPLHGENRYIVKRGLELLSTTESTGLKALFRRCGITRGDLDSEALAFSIIPRLNAAGRSGDAGASLRLLTTEDVAEAGRLADELERANSKRKELAARGIEQAQEQIAAAEGALPPLLFVESEEWSPGVLGLIASSLARGHHRPAVVVRRSADVSRASARSIPEFDIIDAIRSTGVRFPRMGGHPEAAGFTVATERVDEVRRSLVDIADRRLSGVDLRPSVEIDVEASPASLQGTRHEFIQRLAPFGKRNAEPALLMRGARVARAYRVGAARDHWKMSLAHDGRMWDAIAFRQGGKPVRTEDEVDVVYCYGLNAWNGRVEPQLRVVDFRPSASA